MLTDNLRDFLRAAAWGVIVIGVVLAVLSGLRQAGILSPGIVNVGGNALVSVFSLLGTAVASIVQGGVLLVLLSIDERIQNKGQ